MAHLVQIKVRLRSGSGRKLRRKSCQILSVLIPIHIPLWQNADEPTLYPCDKDDEQSCDQNEDQTMKTISRNLTKKVVHREQTKRRRLTLHTLTLTMIKLRRKRKSLIFHRKL